MDIISSEVGKAQRQIIYPFRGNDYNNAIKKGNFYVIPIVKNSQFINIYFIFVSFLVRRT